MLKDVFVQACGEGVYPRLQFMVGDAGFLCRTLVMERIVFDTWAPASEGCYIQWY